jgi:hypothetical protein
MGVDATKLPTGVRGSRHGSLPPAPKSKVPTKEEAQATRQSMAADSRESRGIVLVIVGQF